jgi:hypothetical protein
LLTAAVRSIGHATGTTSASGGYIGGDLDGDAGNIVNGQHDHRLVLATGRQPTFGCRGTDLGADVVGERLVQPIGDTLF